MNKKLVSILSLSPVLMLMGGFAAAQQKEITRGSADGNTSAPFSQHPNSYLYVPGSLETDTIEPVGCKNLTAEQSKTENQAASLKQIAPNMEPIVVHENELKEAAEKLTKFGKQPNILIFITDDVGWMDVGFNGGGVTVGNPTPNLDKIAHEGLILTSAYSAPSSSPTRATIHTGQNPLHHGILSPPMYGQPGGLHGPFTLPFLLKKQGYVTKGVGKWHLGESCDSQPQNVGYDSYYGFLSVSDMYTEWRDQYFNPEIVYSAQRFKALDSPSMFNHCNINVSAADKVGEQICLDPAKFPPCGNKDGNDGYYEINLSTIKDLDQDWADHSVKFIKDRAEVNKKERKPWLLYHATRAAHFDNYPNDKYAGKSPAMTTYSDSIVEIDDIFGRLVETLRETGQLEDTIIFFTSDNGPEGEIPPHGRTPFRGHKGSSWEGGVRVPTFVYWKGQIEPRKSDGLFDLADIFNTSLAVAGVPCGDINQLLTDKAEREEIEKHYIDGIDQTPFLLAKDGQSCRRSRIYTLNQHFSAVRVDEFKFSMKVELEDAIYPKGYSAGFSGAIVTETGGATMTNLYTNPQEDVNVGIRHIPVSVQIGNEIKRYREVLMKYPPKQIQKKLSN